MTSCCLKKEEPNASGSPYSLPEDIVFGYTKRVRFGCGNAYITVNTDNEDKPVQVLIWIGKTGCCQRALLEGVCRLVNRLLDRGESLETIIMCLVGLRCDQGMYGAGRLSCTDALANLLKAHTIMESTGDTSVQQV